MEIRAAYNRSAKEGSKAKYLQAIANKAKEGNKAKYLSRPALTFLRYAL